MSNTTASIVFLVGRIERLQAEIGKSYRDVDRATKEIGVINSLLMQLRSPPPLSEVQYYLSERPPTPHPTHASNR